MLARNESRRVRSQLELSLAYLRERSAEFQPVLGLVLGSGMGELEEELELSCRFELSEIPAYPQCGVEGHRGQLLLGQLEGLPILVQSGRVHLYEGHEPAEVVHGVRVMAQLGVRAVLLTNAAGGIREDLRPGELVALSDHLNLTGKNPLLGSNDASLGPRFPDMSEVYSPGLRACLRSASARAGLEYKEGVYAGLLGPSYETPAEIRMLRGWGADLVGMSTVHEAIALRHLGVEVVGLSCVTNLAAGLSASPLSHEEVQGVAGSVRRNFIQILRHFCQELRGQISF